jgi:hypothetical protein
MFPNEKIEDFRLKSSIFSFEKLQREDQLFSVYRKDQNVQAEGPHLVVGNDFGLA